MSEGNGTNGRVARSLITFGACVGLLTGVSETSGTVVTLLGLLFALIGGTFTALWKKDSFRKPERDAIIIAAGLLTAGLIGGVTVGVAAKIAQYVWLPVRSPPPHVHPAGAEDADASPETKEAKPEGDRGGHPAAPRLPGTLHVGPTAEEIQALREDLRQVATDPSIKDDAEALGKILDQLSAVDRMRARVDGGDPKLNASFRTAFNRVFPPRAAQK